MRQQKAEIMLGIGEKHELPTVLLIDDDMVSREVIATVLTLHGHMVHTADNGEAALELLKVAAFTPAVILMDAQLPGLCGIPLIEKIRMYTQAGIYVISGSVPAADLIAAAQGFLLKPFSPTDLQRIIDENAPKLPPPPPAPTLPVIKAETLSQFRQMMPEATVREIYQAVVTDLRKRHAALTVAIASGDSNQISRIGHAIKGGCGMAGALQAAHLGAILEAESDQLDNCAAAVKDLHAAIGKLERMLKTEFPV